MMNCLHYAVLNENLIMVETIIFADAECRKLVHEKNYRGETPIEMDDKETYEHIFQNVWVAASSLGNVNADRLNWLITKSEKYEVN